VLGDGYYYEIFGRTAWIAALTTLICVAIGAPEAYILSRMRRPWRSVFLLVILAPLLVSVVVRAFGWSLVLGPSRLRQPVLRWVGIGRVRMLYTPIAVVVALVHVMLPFMVIPVWTSLQKLDPHGRERRAVAGRVALHGAAPRRAAAGHAGPAVGRADRVRAQRQCAGHSRPARRPAAEDGGHADLRRIPARAELAAGRGHRAGAAGGQPGGDAEHNAVLEGRYRKRMG
jgi:hypothetical protein